MAPDQRGTPLALRIALIALFMLAFVRGMGLVLHTPLLGLANNYDQIRFSMCLDIAPYRPGVRADAGNAPAPLRLYSFQSVSDSCYWTSDLLLTAPLSWAWRASERFGGPPVHSIRKLGVLRVLVWCLIGAWAARAWMQAGSPVAALASLAALAFAVFDPANSLYFNSFYAEPAAVLGLYLCLASVPLALMRPSRGASLAVLLGACLLATSKIQHVALPALLGFAVLASTCGKARTLALLLCVGSVVGATAAAVNRHQSAGLMDGIATTNRGDFVLGPLLLNVDDPNGTAASLGLSEACAAYASPAGVYRVPPPFERTCNGIKELSDARARLALLMRPAALARAVAQMPGKMLPWIPEYLGLVEGEDHGSLPASQPSLSSWFGSSAAMAAFLLSLPWLILFCALRLRANAAARAYLAMCAAASIGVPMVALFGDGYFEFAKHAHLAFSCVLASLCLASAWAACRWLRPRQDAKTGGAS